MTALRSTSQILNELVALGDRAINRAPAPAVLEEELHAMTEALQAASLRELADLDAGAFPSIRAECGLLVDVLKQLAAARWNGESVRVTQFAMIAGNLLPMVRDALGNAMLRAAGHNS